MKYRAIKNFSGKVNMHVGEEKELDPEVASDLERAGYVVAVKAKAEEAKKGKKENV